MKIPDINNNLKQDIEERFGSRCLLGEELKSYTSYCIGGNAEILLFPATVQEWRFVYNFCNINNIPLHILGAGTNVLVSDEGLKGITASSTLMKNIRIDGDTITAKAGIPLDELVKTSIDNGLGGLEKMSGIPGSVGGAVQMNAGAYGQETFDYLTDFEVLDKSGQVKTLSKNEVEYSYRNVELNDAFILSARWKLKRRKHNELHRTRRDVLTHRSKSQPLDMPSAGSVFKRPSVDYASRLIDKAGLKGYRIGDAQISNRHAGFIVNLGNALASDVYHLIGLIKKKVKAQTGIELELEQKLLGEF